MKKYNFICGLFTTMLLFSSFAGADQKYPASDFQPTVVYQDDDYIAKSGQSKSSTTASSNQSASNTASQPVDSKYPAANFQPKVVYNDPDYKHSQSSISTGSSAQSGSSVSSANTEADSAGGKEGDSSSNYLIGLVLFAVVGFVLFKRRAEPKPQSSSRIYAKDSTGLTGVARYLNRSSGTGVARYLEKQVKAASAGAATGVAKYMARQTASEKTTVKEARTGVEKYMRNRG